MGLIQGLIGFCGRFLLSFIFIASGVHQMLDWLGTEQSLIQVLNDWSALMMTEEYVRNLCALALSWSSVLVGGAICFQLIGGLCILLGVQVRLGAFLLILFLIPATFVFHHFWMLSGPDREMQMIAFMKNMSMLGGLLIILAYGKGKKSRGHEASKPKEE